MIPPEMYRVFNMKRFILEIGTEGNSDIVNLSPELTAKLKGTEGDGLLHLFIPGSTAALTTIEFEPGAVHDFNVLFESLAPRDAEYRHHLRWGDDNGSSHVRAALLGPSLTIPFKDGELMLGTWQQIALFEFDTRPRDREIVVQIVGE
jgi:secondary thiamine-phosphate synthase enzyme